MSINETMVRKAPLREIHQASPQEVKDFFESSASASFLTLRESKGLAKLNELKIYLDQHGYRAGFGKPLEKNDTAPYQHIPKEGEELVTNVYVGKNGICEISLDWAKPFDTLLSVMPINRITIFAQPASGDLLILGQDPLVVKKIDWKAALFGEQMVEDAVVLASKKPQKLQIPNPLLHHTP